MSRTLDLVHIRPDDPIRPLIKDEVFAGKRGGKLGYANAGGFKVNDGVDPNWISPRVLLENIQARYAHRSLPPTTSPMSLHSACHARNCISAGNCSGSRPSLRE